jgi:secondary thiamine-phosphate synthase enzyme
MFLPCACFYSLTEGVKRKDPCESCNFEIYLFYSYSLKEGSASMKSHTVYLTFHTKKRKEIVPITDEVERVIQESGVQEGLALVSAMHITAAVIVNDYEPGLWQDIMDWVEKVAPENPNYRHHRTGEDNGDAHLKNLLLHHQVVIPITQGRFDAGPWQQIFYCEFDGQRDKRLLVKVIGE